MAGRNYIDLVEKTLRVLEAVGPSENGLSLGTIAARVGLVKSSVFRILYTLKALGYVEGVAANGSYAATLKLLALARSPARRPTLRNVARPRLTEVCEQLRESAWLAECRRGSVILIDVVEAPRPLQLSLGVGDRCPLHATALGKAIAAHLPPAELQAALGAGRLTRFTPHTIVRRRQLMSELAKVRRRGFALNEEETIQGAILVGAPIFDSRGRVFASVSVSAPTARCSPEKQSSMIEAVRRAAAAITTDLAGLQFVAAGGAAPLAANELRTA